MYNQIMDKVNESGEVAECLLEFADLFTEYEFWSADNPDLFRIFFGAFLLLIIFAIFVAAYLYNRN